MSGLTVELETPNGAPMGDFHVEPTMSLKDFYLQKVREAYPDLRTVDPSNHMFLPAAGAGGKPLTIAKDEWKQPLTSFLQSAENTVTFILKPPASAPIAAGSGVPAGGGSSSNDAGDTAGSKRRRPAEYLSKPAIVSAFAKTCKTIESDEAGHLAFGDGHQWWLLDHEKLFVRHFYKNLYENVLQKLGVDLTVKMTRRWAIIGTPGIGKTAFGLYLLHQALRQDRCVVHVHGGKEQTMVFYPSGQAERLVRWNEFSALDELDDPSTVLLLDSHKVHYCAAFTVLLTSPDPTRTHAFKEDSDFTSRRLYVPVFSKSEILAMQAACYSTTHNVNDVVALYNKWGGSARAVFNPIRGTEDMREAVNKVDIEYLRKWLPIPVKEKSLDDSKVPSRLFRIYTAADSAESKATASSLEFYAKTGVDFITPYVLWSVLERVRMVTKSELAAFVDLAHTSPKLSRVFDRIFERLCIDAFGDGEKLVAHPLKRTAAAAAAGAPVLVTFPKLTRNDVRGLKGFGSYEPTTPKHVIHVPTSESFPAIDFAIDTIASVEPVELVGLFSSALVNATFDATHTICWEANGEIGLKATLSHWNPSVLSTKAHKKSAFIWLVPEGIMGKWKEPRDFTVDGEVVKANQSGYTALKNIDQYVACIDGLSPLTVTNALTEGKYEDLDFTSVDPEDDCE